MDILDDNTRVDEAVAFFESLVASFPDSRHPTEGLASALNKRFQIEGNREDLQRAANLFVKATDMGLLHGNLPLADLQQAAISLGRLGKTNELDVLFAAPVSDQPNGHIIALYYAQGLAAAQEQRAEEWFQTALRLRPSGWTDPIYAYSKWLFDQDRYAEALEVLRLRPGEKSPRLLFLRGFASERLGQRERAQEEYDSFRQELVQRPGYDLWNPVPSEYRISGSDLQHGITFSDEVSIESYCQGYEDLKKMIHCESSIEPMGAKRAVGWAARNRVFNGNTVCVTTNNSGSDSCERYHNVLTESGQFFLGCSEAPGQDAINAAFDVSYGYAPETGLNLCPYWQHPSVPNVCTDWCEHAEAQGGFRYGIMQFHRPEGDPPCPFSQAWCTRTFGKLCSQPDRPTYHCFYYVY